ncbi:MAG TPA: MFS transporter [Kiritimatiellia bacterium]|nr:MFS transporter [Kiritimatiellia bacterium]
MTPSQHDSGANDRLGSSFLWLNWTQFQGALNDNIFKLLVTFFLIRNLGADKASMLSGLGGIIFALPFILFIPVGGVLADRFSKSRITVIAKVGELVVMLCAALSFWLAPPWVGFVLLFLMSTQSAFFGPTKYGIIPELVQPHQLSRANGYLVALTYLSIILGTVAAPWLTETIIGKDISDNRGDLFALAALVCVLVAGTGVLTSLKVGPTPAMGQVQPISLRFWSDVWRTYQANRQDRFLVLAILASAYFSLIGAFLQLNLIPYAMVHLSLSETDGGFLFLYAALGIGAGSLLAGRLSGRNIEFGMIPVGAMLIAFSVGLLFLLPYGVATTRALIFLAGTGAGLFIIPVEAFIQYRAPPEQRGSIIAANGFLSWVGVLLAGLLMFGLSFVPFWKPAYTFALLGAMTLAVTLVCLKVLPDFFVRFVGMFLVRSVFKIRRVGLEHLPREGGGLVVANHVSTLDAVILLASQQRRIRFLMDRDIYESHPAHRLFRLMQVIPISVNDNPKELVRIFQRARAEMDAGFLVGIFAEGAITRTGQMRPFRPGFERIMKGSDYPIIPAYIGGLWLSRFSRFRSVFRGERAPRRLRVPVTVAFGPPLSASATAVEAQEAVRELSAAHYDIRRGPDRHAGLHFIRAARRYFRRPAMDDTLGKSVTYGKALIGALVLARVLGRIPSVASSRRVGVVLPPSVGGSLVNLGLVLAGKTPVNLNFTTSAEAFSSSLRQADISVVITAGKMMEKASHLVWPEQVVLAETLVGSVTGADRLIALAKALLAPACWLAGPAREGGDDLLTIMFSSGTTGEPKGVMLSHHNVLSNVEALVEAFRPDGEAHLCATLPIFHSFGFTAGIYFPLLCGLRVSYHVSPLDTGKVIDVIRERRCNTLFTTPSFLTSYYRKAEPSELATLKFVVVGAEKLKKQLADAFEQKFGVRPLEGYGTTEMAPVVALNVPDVEDPRTPQVGGKDGSIGQPLPGIAARIVDPESGAPMPRGEAGMLLVRGPNRMLGYLHRPDLTGAAIRDGWYVTGDIAKIDDEGFIFITDRIHRFSKIGGEMVPHMAAEDVVATALNLVEPAVAVTAIPDETKGERLVLLYTPSAGDPRRVKEALAGSGLPNLWKPAESMFFVVEHLPLTSSGKLDVRGIKELARACVAKARQAIRPE